jgi:hypothetical protein
LFVVLGNVELLGNHCWKSKTCGRQEIVTIVHAREYSKHKHPLEVEQERLLRFALL